MTLHTYLPTYIHTYIYITMYGYTIYIYTIYILIFIYIITTYINIYVYIYILCMCVCVYIYMYIYMCVYCIHKWKRVWKGPWNHPTWLTSQKSQLGLPTPPSTSPFSVLARYPLEHLPRQAGCLLGCSHISTPGLGGWTWHPIQHPSTTQGVDVHPLNLRNSASL